MITASPALTSPLTAAQDRNYWASSWEEGSELLTAWVALSDVGVESGPMTFVRGSNAWGLLEGCGFFHEQSLEEQKAACLAAAPAGAQWAEEPAILPAGSMSLHDNYTLHGYGPNFSDTYRRSLAIHMRTNKSAPTAESAGAGLCAFLHDIEGANPVVYGRDAFVAQHRDGLLAPAAASSAKL